MLLSSAFFTTILSLELHCLTVFLFSQDIFVVVITKIALRNLWLNLFRSHFNISSLCFLFIYAFLGFFVFDMLEWLLNFDLLLYHIFLFCLKMAVHSQVENRFDLFIKWQIKRKKDYTKLFIYTDISIDTELSTY